MCIDLWHKYIYCTHIRVQTPASVAQHSPLPFHYPARTHTCTSTHNHTHLTVTPGRHSWSHPHYHTLTLSPSCCHTLTLSPLALSHPHPTPPPHSSTLSLVVQVDLTTDYQGFVRVHMCVTRPIHVSAGVTKNSWYGLMKPVRAKSRRYARGKGKAPRRDAGRDCGDNEVCWEGYSGTFVRGYHWRPAVCLL